MVFPVLARGGNGITAAIVPGRLDVQFHDFHAIMIGVILPPFYPVLDTALLTRVGLFAEDAAEPILQAGARILQFRHKDFFSRQVFESAARVAVLWRAPRALFLEDDRAYIA